MGNPVHSASVRRYVSYKPVLRFSGKQKIFAINRILYYRRYYGKILSPFSRLV